MGTFLRKRLVFRLSQMAYGGFWRYIVDVYLFFLGGGGGGGGGGVGGLGGKLDETLSFPVTNPIGYMCVCWCK